jgi:ABC-type Na+ efflux pump permease subunit
LWVLDTAIKIWPATFLAAAYRFCAVLVLMVLVISTLVREFNDKCLELYLSLTISRPIYFIGKMAGFFAVSTLLAAIFAAVLLLYAEPAPVLLWFLSLACELTIVASVSVFCVITFNQQIPASFAAAFFFYLMSRSADSIVLISKSEILLHTTGNAVISFVVDNLAVALPSLARFTQTDWVAYGNAPFADALPLIALQTVIYVMLIGGVTLVDFSRKNL